MTLRFIAIHYSLLQLRDLPPARTYICTWCEHRTRETPTVKISTRQRAKLVVVVVVVVAAVAVERDATMRLEETWLINVRSC